MDYHAPWWLPGGNAQTIWAALRSRRYLGAAPVFERERWATPDEDFVDIDWLVDRAPTLFTSPAAPCNALPPGGALSLQSGEDRAPTLPTACGSLPPEGALRLRPGGAGSAALAGEGTPTASGGDGVASYKRPLLVVFHGLEGSSGSHYAEAFAAVARIRGWACAVPHFRGCSGEMNRAPRAYHSGDVEEIDWILRRFAARHGGPVVAVGISLGGNALMRWAGEREGSARQVVSAVASVCSPLDLTASGKAIGEGFNRLVYTRMFLSTMVPKALQKLQQHPGLFDGDRLRAARDLYTFDDVFTGPVHGFRNATDYWTRASAKPVMVGIGVPALALNALNDPFVPTASLPTPADVSARVTLWQPAQGGHVGFPSGRFPGHVRAMPEAVAAFFAAHL